MKPLLLTALLCLFTATTLRADVITLKDGTTREGTVVSEDDKSVTVEMRAGTMRARLTIPRNEIASVEKRAVVEAPAKPKPSEKTPEAKDTIVPPPPQPGAKPRMIQVSNGVWIQETDREKLITQELEKLQQAENLVIAPRKDPAGGPLTPAEIERERMIEAALEKVRRSEVAKLSSGDSLLSRYGYFAPGGGTYIGGAAPDSLAGTRVWYDGYGYVTPNTEFFAGTVGTSPYWFDRWGGWGGWGRGYNRGYAGPNPCSGFVLGNNSAGTFRRNFGYSPGFRWGQFSFGTNYGNNIYGPYGSGYGYGSGFNLNLSGGNKNFKYNLNFGGW